MPIPFSMSLDGVILQFVGSLVAILFLAGLAYWLGLGGKPSIASSEHARGLATEVTYGFDAVNCTVDAKGKGALLVDGRGRIMILKPHGSHFAGRILNASSDAYLEGDQILVDPGERRFGNVTLELSDGGLWMERIKALRNTSNA
jgi:hypothetical protein